MYRASGAFSLERNKFIPERSKFFKTLNKVKWSEDSELFNLIEKDADISAPLKVGVLFSGGPASGGNNVIAGLFDAITDINCNSELIGFLGGPSGLLTNDTKKINEMELLSCRNIGGFNLLGTGRTKIEEKDQLKKVLKVIDEIELNALVFIGGDDTSTTAYHLSNYLIREKSECAVIVIPKTIDGDLKSNHIEISFGFDTACKVYSEIIGNICIDAVSSLKYWHFIKVMGRKASHIALECALQTNPNIAIISEEIGVNNTPLKEIVNYIVDAVEKRALCGRNYGVVLLPEGLLEFIPEMKKLILELNRILAANDIIDNLTKESKFYYEVLPKDIQKQLLEERDSHGNVKLSIIDTEKLISWLVKRELCSRDSKIKFNAMHHFIGYEGRCAYPSIFDATYCYNLGYVGALLARDKKSSVMAGLKNLTHSPNKWMPIGVKLSSMMCNEERNGVKKKVVKKTLVDLNGCVFKEFVKIREENKVENNYYSPGPIQYFGEASKSVTKTLSIESSCESNSQ